MAVGGFQVSRTAARRVSYAKQSVLFPTKRRQKSNAVTNANSSTALEGGKAFSIPNTIPSLPLWQRLGPLSKAFSAYGRAQRTRPYVTQVCSSLVMYFCGDMSAQSLGNDDYNPLRTVRNMVIGGVCSLPSYRWFLYLGESFNYSSKILSLSTKVVVNQIVFTPIFTSYFFGMHSLLSGDSFLEAQERIKRTVPVSFINSCKLWPTVMAFNFTYIQPQYRAFFAGFVAVGWQSYLSWLNRKAERDSSREALLSPMLEKLTPDSTDTFG